MTAPMGAAELAALPLAERWVVSRCHALVHATTAQLAKLDELAAAVEARRAALRPLAWPLPLAGRRAAWGTVGAISDPLGHAVEEYCLAADRCAARRTRRAVCD